MGQGKLEKIWLQIVDGLAEFWTKYLSQIQVWGVYLSVNRRYGGTPTQLLLLHVRRWVWKMKTAHYWKSKLKTKNLVQMIEKRGRGERVRNWNTVFRNKNREKKRYSVRPSKDRHWNPASSFVLILKAGRRSPNPFRLSGPMLRACDILTPFRCAPSPTPPQLAGEPYNQTPRLRTLQHKTQPNYPPHPPQETI